MIKKSFILLAALFILVGCRKETSFVGSTDESSLPEAVVDIRASLEDVEVETKGSLGAFADGADYGIFACISVYNTPAPATPYMQFKPSLWNAKARKVSGGWRYHHVSNYTTGALYSDGASTAKFVLQGRNDDKTADLYAYSPYIPSAYFSGPEAIPFTRNLDLKYAVQNNPATPDPKYTDSPNPGTPDPNPNHHLNPASGSELSATFDFRRMMAALVFSFTLDTPNNTTMRVYLDSIEDANPSGGAVLYTGGTFNAITGTFNSGMGTTDKLTSNLGYCDVSDAGGAFSITLVPTTVTADDELIFTFSTGGHTLPPFKLKVSQVTHVAPDPRAGQVGFLAGYKYTFHFTLDNYVRFDGFDIKSWGSVVELPHHGVI